MSVSAQTGNYFDNFQRPDAADLGGGWIEKQPGAFSLAGGVVLKNQVTSDYLNNVVYRPAAESLLDTEASIEMRFQGASIGYPLLFVRVQTASAAQLGSLDAYVMYMDNSPTRAVLGRQRGSAFVFGLQQLYLDQPLNSTDTFRMRLRATGSNPVELRAWVERQTGSGWEILAETSVTDNAGNRIATAGSVGFGGYIESGYSFDNFTRVDLSGGGTTNPVPTTTGLAPSSTEEGAAGFSLTVQGSNFVPGSVVRWNGADRPTTYVSANELQAAITATDLSVAGTATVTVFNAAPGGGISNSQAFNVTAIPGNPVPAIASLAPDSVVSGGSGFTLSVSGSGFLPDSTVRLNGADRQTTYVSATRVDAAINAADIATAGSAAMTVFNPGPGGGLSNSAVLTITDPMTNPTPVIAAISPSSVIAGGGAFTLSVQGQDFIDGSVVRWNGVDRATTFTSTSQLSASISAADVASAGTASVTVFTPAPGGGTSNVLSFTIDSAGGGNGGQQGLNNISPIAVTSGSNGVQLTLNGFGFTQNSMAQVSGIAVPTTFVNSNQLLADVDSGLLSAGLRSAVTVRTPGADNVVTLPQTLFILEDGEALFFDNFNRADSQDLGNAWTEKEPSVFSLSDGAVSGISTPSLAFNHVITYRPQAEDAQNVEVGMEFVRPPGSNSLFPQVHARVQRDTVTFPGLLSSYTLFFDSYNSPGQIHITPIQDWYECYIASWDLTAPFVEGERYRLRLRVTGSDPVLMVAYMDRLNVDYWQVIGSGTVLHDPTSAPEPGGFCNSNGMIPPITGSGSTGFAKWRDPSDSYDNFYTIRLGATANPVPLSSGLSPSSAVTGSPAFELTVNGSDFVPGAVVRWNGADRPTTYVSPSELRASISAADLASAGSNGVTVFNPLPGGGLSNVQTFNVTDPLGNPAPNLTTLSPDMVVVSSAGFTLMVGGSNFVPGSVVRWNGTDRPTSYVSATQLQAAISAADIAAAGTAAVTVFNPSPGGGISNDITLTILDQGADYFDDFSRPDAAALGGGWIEKQPSAFALASGAAVKNAVTTGYRDNIVYRPADENILDTEASVELRFANTSIGYPQLWARLQTDTVGTANVADSYILYVDNSPTTAILGRQRGSSFVFPLAILYMDTPFNSSDRFRMRLRAVGTNPVALTAYIERLGQSGWEVIGQTSASDSAANRISTPGSVGFGGYVEGNYSFDNFTRLYQLP